MAHHTTTAELPGNSWRDIVSRYNRPNISRSIWQMVNSIIPYMFLWFLMYESLKISYWITLPLTMLAAGFLIRIFIIFHDCGHGSFFRSKKLNMIVGNFCGILTFTPYERWTNSHKIHHQTVGNLDKRGTGDVWTLTVDEYLALSHSRKIFYRIYRNPLIMFGLGAYLIFMITNRFTHRRMTWKQRWNIYFTNAAILLIAIGMSFLIGLKAFLLIQLPVMYFASIGGVYLFYLQHQFDDVIWSRQKDWDYKKMAMEGSSFFKLPGLLRWFSGNIGFHHIHHLGPTIPNYNLARCHNENPVFRELKPITFFTSFKALKIKLWDEKLQRAVSFRDIPI